MIAGGIADYIDSNNLLDKGVNLFVSIMPDSPDNCACVYDEAGAVKDQNHYDNSDSFGTMIKFRGSYSWIKTNLLAVHRLVTGLGNITLDGLYLLDTRIQTEPMPIDIDEKGRREYTVHYEHYVKIGGNTNRNNN